MSSYRERIKQAAATLAATRVTWPEGQGSEKTGRPKKTQPQARQRVSDADSDRGRPAARLPLSADYRSQRQTKADRLRDLRLQQEAEAAAQTEQTETN